MSANIVVGPLRVRASSTTRVRATCVTRIRYVCAVCVCCGFDDYITLPPVRPQHGLTNDEMRPYVARVLGAPSNWMVHSSALVTKCALEFEGQHTRERATLQLQSLVDQHTARLTPLQFQQSFIDDAAPAGERMRWGRAVCRRGWLLLLLPAAAASVAACCCCCRFCCLLLLLLPLLLHAGAVAAVAAASSVAAAATTRRVATTARCAMMLSSLYLVRAPPSGGR